MSNRRSETQNPAFQATEPMLTWWRDQLSQSANPMARMQLAWMESLVETMQYEAKFLQAMAESGQRMAESFQGKNAPRTPAEFNESYQKMIKEITDAQMERLEKASNLSNDFRKRVWEEL